jgi:hypothetical protein
MRQLIGVLFLVISTIFSLVLVYCLGLAIVGYYGYFGVAAGVAMSTVVSWMITRMLLKAR